jgi:DNA-formamidopyrimidine glycosylase
MPEGPEVARIAESLHDYLHGATLKACTLLEGSRYSEAQTFPGLEHLTPNLELERVRCRGKKIVFEFTGGIYLISFLGLEGKWRRTPAKHDAFHMQFERDGVDLTVYYNDTRHFGSLEVCTTLERLQAIFDAMGPDLLHDEISWVNYYLIITNPNVMHKSIAWFLLEQRFLAGIGNYLRSEILYLSRIAPHRLMRSLTDDERIMLYEVTLHVIWEAYRQYGLTLSTYADLYGNLGQYRPLVYGRSRDDHGHEVQRLNFNGRTVHWVPQLQQ